MQIRYHKHFAKQYKKLTSKQRNKVRLALRKFQKNPHNTTLRNHPLKGNRYGERSISVTGDLRIIFIKDRSYRQVTLLQVGTHAQVYK